MEFPGEKRQHFGFKVSSPPDWVIALKRFEVMCHARIGLYERQL
jgi:hypothetical protein